ncbi:MAG: hypothetical protein HY361_03705 [Candidatus Aenigmarchaeota archaeon]|nr:hypothetical protein [Candidatus Aenigmarchaeota archaeon]
MKGDLTVTGVILVFLSFVVVSVVSYVALDKISKQILEDAKRTTTQIVALDISSLISLTNAAAGDIVIDYKTDKRSSVAIENRIITVKGEDSRKEFNFSIPFDAGKLPDQSGLSFVISRVDGVTRIVAER